MSETHDKGLGRGVRWTASVLCVFAAGLSLWLSIEKLSGRIDSLAGCGAGSGCSNVLGSKWSMVWAVVPVSLFSLGLYLAIWASLWGPWSASHLARKFRCCAAWLCLWAACWFTALQLFVLDQFCPYCMTSHALGSLLGLCLLVGERGKQRRMVAWFCAGLAMLAVLSLALIQHLGPEPETHRVDVLQLHGGGKPSADLSEHKAKDIHARGEGRLVQFLNGGKSYRVKALPHLGSADATHVLVKYFDYTCAACREMHELLEQEMARHPGELAVIVLPVPLNRSCNQYLPEGAKNHQHACELARLALKVWRADPSKFADFHRQLFESEGMPLEVVESLAIGMVGEQAIVSDSEWVDELLKRNVADYRVFVQSTPVMPKLLIVDKVVVQGLVADKATLDALLEKYLGLK
ncbi:thioredoxin domain-containing protein [Verrucomicrobiaceae bacterium N1E253]|uniref:Thioredoxin domain-containing protein n=1 Tax=Oceaniferula marina TaxID=2748318 RepID=A0A851GT60_9BACT|nr:vitamin K epoxide reductase family protein [Oceaniferula marina]NWK57454.1 thioredoxin domain-containing protein [Oceaniferula marina]